MSTIIALLALHFLCDFALQGDFMARAKNHATPIDGVPWWLALFGHATIHAGAVGLVLPLPYVLCELWTHLALDWAKNEGLLGKGSLGFAIDQGTHVALKVLYAAVWLA